MSFAIEWAIEDGEHFGSAARQVRAAWDRLTADGNPQPAARMALGPGLTLAAFERGDPAAIAAVASDLDLGIGSSIGFGGVDSITALGVVALRAVDRGTERLAGLHARLWGALRARVVDPDPRFEPDRWEPLCAIAFARAGTELDRAHEIVAAALEGPLEGLLVGRIAGARILELPEHRVRAAW